MTWLDVPGVANLRDVGGLALPGGATTAYGVLWRSDDPRDLTVVTVGELVDRGLRAVVDLRMPAEVEAADNAWLWAGAGVQLHHLNLMPHINDVESALQLERAIPDQRPDAHADEHVVDHVYADYVTKAPQAVADAVRAVAEADGAVLVHCAAGKDRTGVVVASALALAGVPREVIVADYLRSEERIEAIRERLLASEFYRPSIEARTLDSMRARAGNLERFLDRMKAAHEDLTGFAAFLGLPEETVQRLRARLIVPPAA